MADKHINLKNRSVFETGTMIVVGSDTEEQRKSVEYYNSDSNEWVQIMNLDVDRTYYQSAILEEKLLLVGGYKEGKASNVVQVYDFADLPTGKVTTLAPMNHPRCHHKVAVLSRNLFAMGGFDGVYISSMESYSLATDKWTESIPMPTGRAFFGIAVNEGEIYTIGGYNIQELSFVDKYSPVSNRWEMCAPMNEKRSEPGVVSFGKFIYAVGGVSDNVILNSVERYDPLIDKWTNLESMNLPLRQCEAIGYNDSLIVAGGFDSETTKVSTVSSYENDQWTTVAPLSAPRAGFCLVELPWKLELP